MTDILFDQEKSRKEKVKESLFAVIESIATEVIARGTAMIALGVATANPALVAGGTGLVVAGGTVKGLGKAAMSKFRDGTEFSPAGTALVGEDGPELLTLPQGSRITPNNQITNNSNDNRNININVQANNGIELVNDLQQAYGINVFEGG